MGGAMPVALDWAVIVIQAANRIRVVVAVAVILGVTMKVVVPMGIAISMPMATSCGIGAGLRQEGGQTALQLQPPLLQQIG